MAVPTAIVAGDDQMAILLIEQFRGYDVVQVVPDIDAAASMLVNSCAGHLAGPAEDFGMGLNAAMPVDLRKAPRAIVIAGDIPEERVRLIRRAFESDPPCEIVIGQMKGEDEMDPVPAALEVVQWFNELIRDETLIPY